MITHEQEIITLLNDGDWDAAIQLIPHVRLSVPIGTYEDAIRACSNSPNMPQEALCDIVVEIHETQEVHISEMCCLVAADLFMKITPATIEHLICMKDFNRHDDKWCCDLLSHMWDNYYDEDKERAHFEVLSSSKLKEIMPFFHLEDLMTKTKLLLTAGNLNSDNVIYEMIKHAPCAAIWLELRIHPEKLTQKDQHGNMLLHFTASFPVGEESCECTDSWKGDLSSIGQRAIEIVLEINPHAAKISNKDGRFPLHIFLEENKDIDQIDRESQALALIDAAPEVLEVRDSKTRLFPFMLAATGKTPCFCCKYGSVAHSSCDCEIYELNLIHAILLKNPSVIKNSLTKDYFRAEIIKVERMINMLKEEKDLIEKAKKLLENKRNKLEKEIKEREEKIISKMPIARKKIRVE